MTGITRRHLLLAAVAAGVCGDMAGLAVDRVLAAPGSHSPRKPFLPYSADAFYKASLIPGLPIDADLTSQFRAWITGRADQAGWDYPHLKGAGTDRWGMPYAESTSADPIWHLSGSLPPPVVDQLVNQGFHAPDWLGGQLTGTTDSPFVVCDKATGISLWGHGAAADPTQRVITCGDAGYFVHASNGLDQRAAGSDSTVNYRTRGIISDAMVIRRSALEWATANGQPFPHVLHLFIPEPLTAAGWCWPLINCEKNKYGWGAEGWRLAVDPAIDLTTRGMTPAGLALARGLQTHGVYIGDTSGGEASLKLEQTSATHNPWSGFAVGERELAGITWDDWVVINPGAH